MKDRRKIEAELQSLLKALTLSQESHLDEAENLGFELAFIRKKDDGNLAVFQNDDKYLTVNDTGEIDYQPDVKTRP
ncbi:hypothetical protein [Pseudoalteromonas denitrificans]|uniref:Uncharacterized protein n=1 Tax=Pseudoalteromonas denitrificans DSM 6059 TaxID=1123010 RepID=A0A1I1LGT0_9GAMM|nr:hypothetical protein [Pseudoalteromonas denitrificans]SFC72201.1 hypothetical protein SAMN02745724_02372 [Pseudoalteromonas denitrificans DSM 6059]